jgi:hypothetical protein
VISADRVKVRRRVIPVVHVDGDTVEV